MINKKIVLASWLVGILGGVIATYFLPNDFPIIFYASLVVISGGSAFAINRDPPNSKPNPW